MLQKIFIMICLYVLFVSGCATKNYNAPKGLQKEGSGNVQIIDSPGAGAK